jgi:hypothetical protein
MPGRFARQCRNDWFHHKRQMRARYIQLSECRMGPDAGTCHRALLAEMMTGETPFAGIRPFAVERFG